MNFDSVTLTTGGPVPGERPPESDTELFIFAADSNGNVVSFNPIQLVANATTDIQNPATGASSYRTEETVTNHAWKKMEMYVKFPINTSTHFISHSSSITT